MDTVVPDLGDGAHGHRPDQEAFAELGVPGVHLSSGAHLDYHRPTDTIDKIEAFLPIVDEVITGGLATVEKVHIRFYRGDEEEA